MVVNMVVTKELSFLELLGGSPRLKILEFFIIARNFDYPMSDIVRRTELSRITCQKEIDKMVKSNILITEQFSPDSSRLTYKLNLNNKQVKVIVEIYDKFLFKKY